MDTEDAGSRGPQEAGKRVWRRSEGRSEPGSCLVRDDAVEEGKRRACQAVRGLRGAGREKCCLHTLIK